MGAPRPISRPGSSSARRASHAARSSRNQRILNPLAGPWRARTQAMDARWTQEIRPRTGSSGRPRCGSSGLREMAQRGKEHLVAWFSPGLLHAADLAVARRRRSPGVQAGVKIIEAPGQLALAHPQQLPVGATAPWKSQTLTILPSVMT